MIAGPAASATTTAARNSFASCKLPQRKAAVHVFEASVAWRSHRSQLTCVPYRAPSRCLNMQAVSCETVEYTSGSREFVGYKASPEGPSSGKRHIDTSNNNSTMQPAVIVAHTSIGPHDAFILNVIRDLAAEGYVAFALDMFGEPEVVSGAVKDAVHAPYKENRSLIATNAMAAVRKVQEMEDVDESRIAAIGYCLGGKVVLDLARTGAALKAVVSFHGVLDRPGPVCAKSEQSRESVGETVNSEAPRQSGTHRQAQKIPRIVVFHGYADPFAPPDVLQGFLEEMEELGARYEVRVYGAHVLHAFTRSEKVTEADEKVGFQYCEQVAKDTWRDTLQILREAVEGD